MKNNSEITIVTAFFDIGRGEVKDANLRRDNEKYLAYFEHWARIRNPLVIYTEKKFENAIKNIRKKYGLLEKTEVIIIEDIFSVERVIFEKMKMISGNEMFRRFRYYENAYSNDAKYSYIMLMKYWCLWDANKRNILSERIVWLDFGFDHGGAKYSKSEEFDFLWEYQFSDKVNLFCKNDPDSITGIESLQMMCDCIMGAPIYVPQNLIDEFWELIRNSMNSLISLDCIDDDQQLLLMAYKSKPELFEIHISDWFLPLKEFGGNHLTVREKMEKKKERVGLVGRVREYRRKRNSEQKKFAKRCYERACQYYEE